MTRYLLTFYRDRVFKHHQETSHEVMRKISKIANLFLQMQRTLEQCVSPCVPESVRLRVSAPEGQCARESKRPRVSAPESQAAAFILSRMSPGLVLLGISCPVIHFCVLQDFAMVLPTDTLSDMSPRGVAS